jgi:processive 1,2-diacylglycerol beta-glucosyltransferase
MADILILTASFGMGHKSVANALKEQIEAEYKHVKVSIGDILEIVNPKVKKISSKIYSELTESYPSIYNKLYDVKAKNKNNIIDNMLSSLYYKRFYEYIKIENPKVIISTFPLCSCIVAKVKEEYEDDVILITVITDVVDSWEWIYEGTNKYLVPTEEIKNRLIAKEVNEDIILVTGIPVKKEFLDKNINFSTDQKNTILIVLSGIDSVSKELLKKLDEYTEYKIKIIAGRNEKLYRKLSDMAYSNLEIYGFVNNLNEMMDEAVYIVTKPGGVTVFEAINKEVPLIVLNSNIGQEIGNIEFIKKNKIGIVINNLDTLPYILDYNINNPGTPDKYVKSIKRIKKTLNYSGLSIDSLFHGLSCFIIPFYPIFFKVHPNQSGIILPRLLQIHNVLWLHLPYYQLLPLM